MRDPWTSIKMRKEYQNKFQKTECGQIFQRGKQGNEEMRDLNSLLGGKRYGKCKWKMKVKVVEDQFNRQDIADDIQLSINS